MILLVDHFLCGFSLRQIRKGGFLKSAGDCDGINAAIYTKLHWAIDGYGWEVIIIYHVTQGLMKSFF